MKKILIIEDDPIVGQIYQTRLEKEGYETEIAADGQSGFYRIHEFHPDAVLLDLMLPKMNGVDILKKIRAQGQFQKTPIIVFTNAYVPNMIHESFQAGATHVFNKATLTPRQILDALHNAINFAMGGPADGAGSNDGSATHRFPGPGRSTAARGLDLNNPQAVGESPFHSATPGLGASPRGSSGRLDQSGSAFLTAPQVDETADSDFQAELLQSFMASAPAIMGGIRKALQEFSKAPDEESRLPQLLELYRKVHALTSNAGIGGLHNISQMAAALEVLLKELYEKPKNINASTMRTVAHTVDFVGELFNKGTEGDLIDSTPINILVVDDEILSRRAVTYALEKANLKSVSVEEPQVALNLATESAFDLIFLDVQMPGMDGFDLCTRIRALPINKTTPVIFVTSLTDFKSRARSSLSGGTDLIAKPFMFIELSVKALTYVLRGRLSKTTAQAA